MRQVPTATKRFLALAFITMLVFRTVPVEHAQAVTFDAASDSTDQTSTTGFTWNHTVGSGTDRILIVGVSSKDTTDADRVVSGVTFNGVAMTNIRTDDNTGDNVTSDAWYMVAPPVGTYAVAVSFAGTVSNAIAGAVSFTGVDQSNPIDAQTGGSTSNSSTVSTSIVTTTASTIVMDVFSNSNDSSITPDASQTQRWMDGFPATFGGGASTEAAASAGSVAMDWSGGSSFTDWAHTVIALRDSNAPPPPPVTDSFPSASYSDSDFAF